MWPRDYIDWARRSWHLIYRMLVNGFIFRCNDPQFQADIPELTRTARRHAFNLANERQQYAERFNDEHEFRDWTSAIAFKEAVRLYLTHPAIEPRIQALSTAEMRILLLYYLDRLPDHTIAQLTGIAAHREAIEASRVNLSFGELRNGTQSFLEETISCPVDG